MAKRKRSVDLLEIRPHTKLMFGDYPIDDPHYWYWIVGVSMLGLASLFVMFTLK